MPSFSQSFLASLGQPRFAQGMFDVGQAIGGIGGQLAEKRRREAEAQELAGLSPDSAEYLQTLARQYEARGDRKAAIKYYELAKQAKRQAAISSAGGMLTSGDPSEIRKGAKVLMQEGEISAGTQALEIANQRQAQKGLSALMKYAGNRKINLANKKDREGFYRIASAYEIPVETANELFDEVTSKGEGGSYGSEVIIRDENGNLFQKRTLYNGNKATPVVTPFPNSSSPTPQGEISIVSGTTGIGGFDKPGIAGKTKAEEQYTTSRVEAVEGIPEIRRTLAKARRAKELLDEFKTGGFTQALVNNVQKFFGVTPKNKGEFMVYAGAQVLAGLESFSGAISNEEREYVKSLQQNLEKSRGENLAFLEEVIDHTEYVLADAVLKAKSDSFADYLDAVMSIDPKDKRFAFDKDPGQEPKTVRWEDLN